MKLKDDVMTFRLSIVMFLVVTSLISGCGKTISPEFSMSKSTGQAPLMVDFTNLTEGADDFQWDFGDGTESAEREPSHTYTKAGTYTVTLQVVEQGEAPETNQATQTVTVEPGSLSQLVLNEGQRTLTPQKDFAFSVDALDEFDNAISGLTLTFRSAEQAGQIDDQGRFTAGTKPGDYADAVRVEATQGGVTKSASADITINPGPPDHVAITPSKVTVPVAQQQQFEARVFDAFNNEIRDVAVVWEADTAGSINTNGLFRAGSDSGQFTNAIKATVVEDNRQAFGTASVGIPLTIGPYTWPPGKNTEAPTSFEPKHRKCWASLRASPSPDFPNPYDTIRGPVDVAYLRDLKVAGHKLLHDDWSGHVIAVTAGATARITLYPEEDFGGEPHTIDPGGTSELEDSQLKQVASLKIEYAP